MFPTFDAHVQLRRSAALLVPAVLLFAPAASASPEIGLSNTSHDERAPQASCAKPGDPARPCLIVHEYDHPSGDMDVRGQVVQVDGTVTSAVLPLAASYDDEVHPAIASMISIDAYLLVWEHVPTTGSSEIKAQRLQPNGLPLGAPFTVASSGKNERRPAVACSHDECLVVWEHEYSATDVDVYARRFDNDGTPNGSSFVVTNSGSNETRPAVDAYGDESPTYYVAWEKEHAVGDRDIVASFIASASVSPPLTLASSAKDETHPDIACRFERSCFVIHELEYAAGDRDIRAHLLDTNTSPVTPTITSMTLVSSSADEHGPTIDRDAVYDHDYTMAWQGDTSATTAQLTVQRRSVHDGSWQDDDTVASSAGPNADPRLPTIAGSASDDFLVAWQERGTGASLDIAAAPISFP